MQPPPTTTRRPRFVGWRTVPPSKKRRRLLRGRRGSIVVVGGGGAFKNDDDGDTKGRACPPFRLPARLWTDATDSKTPEEKCSQIYQAYITMAATRVVMAQDDGFGNECSEDVVVSETTSKILEHKEGHGMLCGTSFVRSMLMSPDPTLRKAALRIIETRRVYASSEEEGMDWESSFGYAKEDMERWRVKTLKRIAEKSLEE